MAVYIEMTTSLANRPNGLTAGTKGKGNVVGRAGKSSARRPLRGIEVKDDTYASLKVLLPNGEELPLIDSGERDGWSKGGHTNFILQSVVDARAERSQIIQTFGGAYIFFFGEEPRFLDCQAILVNTLDFNWEAEWMANYNCYLRGTKLAEMGARCFLSYDDTVVEGMFVGTQSVKGAENDKAVQVSFKFFVTGCYSTSSVGNPKYPIRSSMDTSQLDLYASTATKDLFTLNTPGLEGTLGHSAFNMDERKANAERRGNQSMFDNFAEDMGSSWNNMVDGATGKSPQSGSTVVGVPSTYGVPPGIWKALQSRSTDAAVIKQINDNYLSKTYGHGNLRGYIADNVDEWTGSNDADSYTWANGDNTTVYDVQTNIPVCSILGAAWYGGVGASVDLLSGLGLMPNRLGSTGQYTMSPVTSPYSGSGVGVSAVSGAGVVYGNNIGGGYVGSLAPQSSYVAGAGWSTGSGASSYSGTVAGTGLGAVYGYPQSSGNNDYYAALGRWNPTVGNGYSYQKAAADNTYVAGANYNLLTGESSTFAGKLSDAPPSFGFGYPSPYAPGPGYGQAGNGSFGGFPYGSGVRADPAFIAPQNLEVSAQDLTIGGVKVGEAKAWSYSGVTQTSAPGTGGATFAVGGSSSAFGQVAMPGTLAPYGNSPAFVAAQSGVGVTYGAGVGVGVATGVGAGAGVGASLSLGVGGGLSMPGGMCGGGIGLGASVVVGAAAAAVAGLF